MALSGCRTEDFAFVAEDGWTSRTLSAPKSRLPPEYPSEWFAAHPGSKPIAIVKRCFASEEHLAKVVSAGLAAGRLPVEYVVQFMHVEGAKIKDTLTEDWKSFGVTIGSAGETISPWDLLSITEQSGPADLADAAVAATADDDNSPHRAGLLAVVVCIYRLLVAKCRGGRREYLQRLQDKALKRILMQFRVGSQYLVEAENNFEHWLKDRSYLSLIAALDMFLHRFRNHDMALLRAGTQVSRYKHCAVLDDLGRVCKETDLKGLELFQWIFFRQAADELFVIYEGGQELLSKNSYAPYLSDLGLSRRSPYSATANPFLHYWCNAASALLGSFKSPKSIVPCDVDFSGATVNAMVLAYATEIIRNRPRPICTINEAQAKLLSNILLNRLNTPRDIGQMPNAFEASQWYQYLSEKSFILDQKISKHCLSRLPKNMRDCSVGAKLAELISK